ncbi:hypothetical protein CRX42_18815 [Pseudomonas jessenii]|jgi:hypothetical protein|uniref:Uncharacterized protein n=1 Tax=Pseudomonas jessenii TaxID=77298 RepID=A0A2W0ESX8_PSEJE|nr:hypothetical protein [Pseudomonas jessenii]PYY68995.1 hypothetical protein CRX42_18815 [Pseudomonas jessenii]
MMTDQLKAETNTSKTAQANTPVPIIKYPLNGTRHNLGRVFIEGECLQGATVEVLNYDDSRLGSAVVNGKTWYFSRNWDEGTKVVRARQSLAGVPSTSTEQRLFFVAPSVNAPRITNPKDGIRLSEGMIFIEGTCTAGTEAVELLNHDFSVLGKATIEPNGTTWRYGRVWDQGVKHVKVRQILDGKPSDPSGQIEFIVR